MSFSLNYMLWYLILLLLVKLIDNTYWTISTYFKLLIAFGVELLSTSFRFFSSSMNKNDSPAGKILSWYSHNPNGKKKNDYLEQTLAFTFQQIKCLLVSSEQSISMVCLFFIQVSATLVNDEY